MHCLSLVVDSNPILLEGSARDSQSPTPDLLQYRVTGPTQLVSLESLSYIGLRRKGVALDESERFPQASPKLCQLSHRRVCQSPSQSHDKIEVDLIL